MSIVHRLLCLGLLAALLPGAVHPGRQPAGTLDNPGNDTTLHIAETAVPSAAPLYKVVAETPDSEPAGSGPAGTGPAGTGLTGAECGRPADAVADSIPRNRAAIRGKKRLNPDVVGWLRVPGTEIDREILQNPAEGNPYALENEYYLNRDFNGQPSKDGVFCADYRATFGPGGRDDLARVTTIYGHSWDDDPDGTLFSQLKKFRDPDFAQSTPYLYFSTETEDMAWEVFAVYDTTIYLPYIRPGLPLWKYHRTLDMIYDLSYYSYDAAVGDDERILALSTCTFSVDGRPSLPEYNEYRFVVMARLVEPDEPRKDEAVFVINESRLPPDATRELADL